MSPTSSLAITDWKEETAQIKLTKPNLIGYYTTDWQLRELSNDISSLKYYDNDIDLTGNQLQLNLNSKNIIQPKKLPNDPIFPYKNWIKKNSEIVHVKEAEIVTFKNVLCNILNAPFHENTKQSWSIRVEVINSQIYLYPNTEATKTLDTSEIKHELLKRYLFVKKPQTFFRKVVSILDKLFYEVYQLDIGEHKLIYTADIAGVLSDQVITNLEELKTADHVQTDIYRSGKLAALEFNYNPLWWAMAVLIRAKHFIIGFFNEQNNLFEIKKITINKLAEFEKSGKIWSPMAAWNFLDNFLTFVKLEISRIDAKYRGKYVWILDYETGKNYITCEPFIAQVIDGDLQYKPVVD